MAYPGSSMSKYWSGNNSERDQLRARIAALEAEVRALQARWDAAVVLNAEVEEERAQVEAERDEKYSAFVYCADQANQHWQEALRLKDEVARLEAEVQKITYEMKYYHARADGAFEKIRELEAHKMRLEAENLNLKERADLVQAENTCLRERLAGGEFYCCGVYFDADSYEAHRKQSHRSAGDGPQEP